MTDKASDWFQNVDLHGRSKLKLFCFPYAGGSASVFRNWSSFLPSAIQVIPVELPGRGPRLREPPFVNLGPLIDDLSEVMPPFVETPYALFGHSMGAVIAFELARRLSRNFGLEPKTLFVSGRRAPQIPDSDSVTFNLPRGEFLETLNKLDGTPKEVLEHTELMEMMIPLLRADFQLVQTYNYVADTPLRCPITAYGGLQDRHVTRETLLLWSQQTLSRYELHMLPGDHFFLRTSEAILLGMIARKVSEVIGHTRFHST